MSLTAILKKIDKVNQKQKAVQMRFNCKSKVCPRKYDLRKEESQDKNIYGYSHSQIIHMFKSHTLKDLDQTRPCTAVFERAKTSHSIVRNQHFNKQNRRAKSANKFVKDYREQYNFLFKQDIFDQNYEKCKDLAEYGKKQKQENKMIKTFTDKASPLSVTKMHSKSIKAERINFINCFEANLQKLKYQDRKPVPKLYKHKIVYERQVQNNDLLIKDYKTLTSYDKFEDVFKLTKTNIDKQPIKKHKITISSSIDNIKEIRNLLSALQIKEFSNTDRHIQFGKYLPLYQSNLVSFLPNKFILTCIIVQTLQSIRIKLVIKNGQMVFEQGKQIFCLQNLEKHLLKNHQIIHLCFHDQGKKLIYEEFVTGDSLRFWKNKQSEIIFLTYYLKRFLLYDTNLSFQSIHQSTQLLLKSFIDVPDDFIEFIDSLGQKNCNIFDKDNRLYTVNLKEILKSALSSILTYKKQKGYGKKVVKLRHGSRMQFKKYMYNWEYFYI